MCLEAHISKELKDYRNVNDIWERNKYCERLSRDIITTNPNVENFGDNVSFSSASLQIFCDSKINVPLLSVFYRCRVKQELTDKIVLPTKSPLEKIAAGEIDRKTNGPFLIQLYFDIKSLPILEKKTIRIEARILVMDVTPQLRLSFSQKYTKLMLIQL